MSTGTQDKITASDITALRNTVNVMRAKLGLSPITWTDPTLVAGTTPIKSDHVVEMSKALNSVAATGETWAGITDLNNQRTLFGTTINSYHIQNIKSVTDFLSAANQTGMWTINNASSGHAPTGGGCGGGCTGTCANSCGGNCDDVCTGTCSFYCQATCTAGCGDSCHTNCGSGCSSGCGSTCAQNCSTACADGCGTDCSTGCGGACSVICSAACKDGCGEGAAGGCGAACSIGCGAACTGGCGGDCKVDCGTKCRCYCSKGVKGSGGGNRCQTCGGPCSGSCGAACQDGCGGACQVKCGGACSTGCGGTCIGHCGSSCATACGSACTTGCGGGCKDNCGAACTTVCGGACSNGCGIACQNTCGINCTGGCLQTCSDYCTTTCTGNCSASCNTACNSLAGAGAARLNLSLDGTVASFAQGPTAWDYIWTAANINDGNRSNAAMASSGSSVAVNNGRGVTVTFNRTVALKRFVLAGYVGNPSINCSYAVEYYNGSSWVNVATIANNAAVGGVLDFNQTGSITSTQWRWYITSWVALSNNFYLYEMECYEYVPDTAGVITIAG